MKKPNFLKLRRCLGLRAAAISLAVSGALTVSATDKKPNILVIFGDDIGQANISAYTKGVMG